MSNGMFWVFSALLGSAIASLFGINQELKAIRRLLERQEDKENSRP